jgi:hypothetical protein
MLKPGGHNTLKSLPGAAVDAKKFTCPLDTFSFRMKL